MHDWISGDAESILLLPRAPYLRQEGFILWTLDSVMVTLAQLPLLFTASFLLFGKAAGWGGGCQRSSWYAQICLEKHPSQHHVGILSWPESWLTVNPAGW